MIAGAGEVLFDGQGQGGRRIADITGFFKSVEAKDITQTLGYFAVDAEFSDPHYPKLNMRGQAEIRNGLLWGFKTMKQFGFHIRAFYPSHDNSGVAVSVDARHILPNGRLLHFQQVFVFRFEGEKIRSLAVYAQYRPNGLLGLVLFFQHRVHHLLMRLYVSADNNPPG